MGLLTVSATDDPDFTHCGKIAKNFHFPSFPKLERSSIWKFHFRKDHFARKPSSPEIKAHHNLRIQNTCLAQLSANVCILVGLLRMGSEAVPRRKASGLQKISDTASHRELPTIL